MSKQYHILNGDALKNQFPANIKGPHIIVRECLVDGDVTGENLEDLYQTRCQFLDKHYGPVTREDYNQRVVSEFAKIQAVPEGAEVNLWFEDDLFCQVNMWFVLHLLDINNKDIKLYTVRPEVHTRYGFGGLSEEELILIYHHRTELKHKKKLGQLWHFYQSNQLEALQTCGKQLENEVISSAIDLHMGRQPSAGTLGRPHQLLLNIIHELGSKDFGPLFKTFCERAPEYGFGDLQVKRLMKELGKN